MTAHAYTGERERGPGAALRRVKVALEAHGCKRKGKLWTCPSHADRTPSLSVTDSDGYVSLICFGPCGKSDAMRLALGLEITELYDEPKSGARAKRKRASNGAGSESAETEAHPPEVEVLGPPTPSQVAWLLAERRITKPETLARIGAQHVRARFWNKEAGAWWPWSECLALPSLAGEWKLWRREGDKLTRLNTGKASLLLSPDLLARNGEGVPRLMDLEGESDFTAASDAGMVGILASTVGAGTLNGHDRHRDRLLSLGIGEVIVIRDRDDAGRKGAAKAAEWWRALGVPVRVLALPAELGEGGDVRDYLLGRIAKGDRPALDPLGGPADLDALADEAPLFEPSDPQGEPGAASSGPGEESEDGERARAPLDLPALGFTGDTLRALRKRPVPESVLPGLLDPHRSLTVAMGKTKTGKTTLAESLARSWVLGKSPWPGAPELPGTRALILSREQTAARIDATLRRLQMFAKDNGDTDTWTDRLVIIARDHELPADGRAMLTLDAGKVAALRASLLAARDAGDPFGLVVLDSLSRLKPPEIEERDNDGLSGWLDSLADLATSCDVHLLLIHHVGHTSDPGRSEARSAGRGASAIAACAAVVWLLERVPGAPNQRRLEIDGNAVLPHELTFEVAGEKAEPGSIHYFRPCDPLAAFDPADLIGAEGCTTSALAWKLANKLPQKGDRPPGAAYRLASVLRDSWERAGRVEVVTGEKGAKLIRLARPKGGGSDA